MEVKEDAPRVSGMLHFQESIIFNYFDVNLVALLKLDYFTEQTNIVVVYKWSSLQKL